MPVGDGNGARCPILTAACVADIIACFEVNVNNVTQHVSNAKDLQRNTGESAVLLSPLPSEYSGDP